MWACEVESATRQKEERSTSSKIHTAVRGGYWVGGLCNRHSNAIEIEKDGSPWWVGVLSIHRPGKVRFCSTLLSPLGYTQLPKQYTHIRPRQQDIVSEIRNVTEISTDHLTPEIKLRLITPNCKLWHSSAEECKFEDPFWAFYWPGGQSLTRFVLDNSTIVKNKKVLDFGSGCGASAIACCLRQAQLVTANDVSNEAICVIQENARLNGVHIETNKNNLIGQTDLNYKTLLVGDMFYDPDFTNMVTDWLMKCRQNGMDVFIGDPGRMPFLNHPIKDLLTKVAEYKLMDHNQRENNGLTHASVWTFEH